MKVINKLSAVAMAVIVANSHSALANTDENKVERIEVTGSHIKRTDMEGPSPIQSLSTADLAATGSTDLNGA